MVELELGFVGPDTSFIKDQTDTAADASSSHSENIFPVASTSPGRGLQLSKPPERPPYQPELFKRR